MSVPTDSEVLDPHVATVDCGEPLGAIIVCELPFRRIAPSMRAFDPAFKLANKGELNLADAILMKPAAVVAGIACALELPVDQVENLPGGKLLELLEAVLSMNKDFFFRVMMLRAASQVPAETGASPT